MTYQLTTLPNGLRVASERLAGAETVAICVSINVGARYESKQEGGISHLLEHMAFKGTNRRNARQIAEEFDMVGGIFNAYTSLEHTVYYAKMLPKDIELAVDILADIMQHSQFDSEELAREQQVVLQEIAMHNDMPDELVFDYFQTAMYGDQPLGRSILGPAKQVESYTRDDLICYMQTHYQPTRMVITASGAVEHDHFLALIQQHFNLPAATSSVGYEPAHYKGTDCRKKRDLEQLHVVLGWSGMPVHNPDYYVLQLFSTILGGGMSSRLFQEIREKRGLVYSINSFVSSYADTGIFGIYAATGEKQANELLPVTCDQVLSMTEQVSEVELMRAKNQLKATLLMTRESSVAVAEWIGRHLLYYDKYNAAQEIAARIDAITTQDIMRVARTVLEGSQVTVTALGPLSQLESYDRTIERFPFRANRAA